MSEALDRGVDELVNEAMRALLNSRVFSRRTSSYLRPADCRSPAAASRCAQRRRAVAVGWAERQWRVPQHGPAPPCAPPLPAVRNTAEQSASRPQPAPAAPSFSVPAQSGGGAAPPLYLIFGNQRYVIDKEQFIIGRGNKSSDLPIRDGNISRKHAVVIRRNGEYYIKDLGSTNASTSMASASRARRSRRGTLSRFATTS